MLARFLMATMLAAMPAAAHAQEREWTLDAGEGDAYLVFGVPETDDVGVSLWCAVQSGEVSLFVPETDPALAPGETVAFTMTAGETAAKITGETTANEEAGTTSLEAKIPDSDPIFAAMLKADRFKVKVNEEESIFPLIDADLAGLLAVCHKP